MLEATVRNVDKLQDAKILIQDVAESAFRAMPQRHLKLVAKLLDSFIDELRNRKP